ncbi:MAG TPA: phosphoglycerate dehydrogenase [Candidatus Limnocylindria bacterium]|nr:phosphoglycerate dehydrogenase [Candidatus Limnocylindria bacterium]
MAETSLGKDKIKVLLLESIDPGAVEAFRTDGHTNVVSHKQALPAAELVAEIKGAHLLGIRSRTHVTKRVLEHADRLIAIGCFGIGTDQVDLDAAEAKGIPVFNAPFSNTRSVAELVLAEIVMLCRGIPRRNAAAHRGEWLKSVAGATEVRGKTLGIVGYGHIGTQIGLLAEGLGMRVIYHDIEPKLALGNATPVDSLRTLLERSAVVTLHVPDTAETVHLIGAEQLGWMQPTAHLINASRGTVVDLDALAAALDAGAIAGAAIDVFPNEPESNAQPFDSPLRRFDSVLLTPHVGGSTVEAQESIGLEVAAKLLKYSNNGSTMTAVNFPQVALPEHRGKHRLLHTHRNIPGMLAAINAVLAGAKINIASQYLETSRQVGYAVIDVDGADRPLSATLRTQLDAIGGTIRTRVLY